MEITSRQRAQLRAMANSLSVILYIGKEGVTSGTIKEAYDALEARELIKCAVLQNAPTDTRGACTILCEKLGAAPVQCIGSKFSIYRARQKDPSIVLDQPRK
jgi:RNA-binding protein